jgi:hypothetical protein
MPQVWVCAVCKKIVRETEEYVVQMKAPTGLETRVHAACVEGK